VIFFIFLTDDQKKKHTILLLILVSWALMLFESENTLDDIIPGTDGFCFLVSGQKLLWQPLLASELLCQKVLENLPTQVRRAHTFVHTKTVGASPLLLNLLD
jgi:hypothetical protein